MLNAKEKNVSLDYITRHFIFHLFVLHDDAIPARANERMQI